MAILSIISPYTNRSTLEKFEQEFKQRELHKFFTFQNLLCSQTKADISRNIDWLKNIAFDTLHVIILSPDMSFETLREYVASLSTQALERDDIMLCTFDIPELPKGHIARYVEKDFDMYEATFEEFMNALSWIPKEWQIKQIA